MAVESLRSWNKRHEIDVGLREGLSTPEREELRELKRKRPRVEQERDLLKRAAAFFARWLVPARRGSGRVRSSRSKARLPDGHTRCYGDAGHTSASIPH